MKIDLYSNSELIESYDDILSVSGCNDSGIFEVLPNHMDIIMTLKASNIAIKCENSDDIKWCITSGLCIIKNGNIEIFVDYAFKDAEIDVLERKPARCDAYNHHINNINSDIGIANGNIS